MCRHSTPEAFLEHAGPTLLQKEAENNLMLGVVGGLVRHPDRAPPNVYLASVEHHRDIDACAIRTPPFHLLVTATPPEAIELVLDEAAEVYGGLTGVLAPEPTAKALADLWSDKTGASVEVGMSMRIYQLDRVVPPASPPSGRVREATLDDLATVTGWMEAFVGETGVSEARDRAELARRKIGDRTVFLWEDPDPVSMAAWTGKTPTGVRINAVYTPPELRRRGYASACVAALSQRMLDEGRSFCFLFTDLKNPTSNRIYQEMGYEGVCDVTAYDFGGG